MQACTGRFIDIKSRLMASRYKMASTYKMASRYKMAFVDIKMLGSLNSPLKSNYQVLLT